jgi:hypothetical protein
MNSSDRPTLKGNLQGLKDRGISPYASLMYAMFWLRGGCAHKSKIFRDLDEWKVRHGEPTWDNIIEWADQCVMEAEIAEPIVRRTALGDSGDDLGS